jgi:hypothetical protein
MNNLSSRLADTVGVPATEYLFGEEELALGLAYAEQASVAFVAHELGLPAVPDLRGGGDDASDYLRPGAYAQAMLALTRAWADSDERKLARATAIRARVIARKIFNRPEYIDGPLPADAPTCRAFLLLRDNWEIVRELWCQLYENETLTGDDVRKLIKGMAKWRAQKATELAKRDRDE